MEVNSKKSLKINLDVLKVAIKKTLKFLNIITFLKKSNKKYFCAKKQVKIPK